MFCRVIGDPRTRGGCKAILLLGTGSAYCQLQLDALDRLLFACPTAFAGSPRLGSVTGFSQDFSRLPIIR
jgi:hypothetical protein